jgi:hypothetical protein
MNTTKQINIRLDQDDLLLLDAIKTYIDNNRFSHGLNCRRTYYIHSASYQCAIIAAIRAFKIPTVDC